MTPRQRSAVAREFRAIRESLATIASAADRLETLLRQAIGETGLVAPRQSLPKIRLSPYRIGMTDAARGLHVFRPKAGNRFFTGRKKTKGRRAPAVHAKPIAPIDPTA